MATKHSLIFEKYRNKASRLTCPSCGKPNCLTRYLGADGNPISDICGRCDHVSSCGYDYTPGQYFRDNPWEREQRAQEARRRAPPPKPDPVYIQPAYVAERHSRDSEFYRWLARTVGVTRADQAFERYLLGATKPGKFKEPAVIFWQIDRFSRVHDGKLMWYKPDGHRQKWMTWISAKLKDVGLYPDQDTEKCLFGEHLLSTDDGTPIALVESEKSAILCSCLFQGFRWVASCGCGGLNSTKLRPLRGQRVLVFPDSGSTEKWGHILETSGLDYSIVSDIDRYPPNTDLVDILVDKVQPNHGQPIDIHAVLANFITI